jgi:hypothetical protein
MDGINGWIRRAVSGLSPVLRLAEGSLGWQQKRVELAYVGNGEGVRFISENKNLQHPSALLRGDSGHGVPQGKSSVRLAALF